MLMTAKKKYTPRWYYLFAGLLLLVLLGLNLREYLYGSPSDASVNQLFSCCVYALLAILLLFRAIFAYGRRRPADYLWEGCAHLLLTLLWTLLPIPVHLSGWLPLFWAAILVPLLVYTGRIFWLFLKVRKLSAAL